MDEQELKNKIFTKTFGAYGELKMSRFCNFLHCYFLGILFSRRFFCVFGAYVILQHNSFTTIVVSINHLRNFEKLNRFGVVHEILYRLFNLNFWVMKKAVKCH
jgi:hypothetical protein